MNSFDTPLYLSSFIYYCFFLSFATNKNTQIKAQAQAQALAWPVIMKLCIFLLSYVNLHISSGNCYLWIHSIKTC